MSTKEHKSRAPRHVRVAVITISTSRSLAEDKSGQWIKKHVEKEGHTVVYHQVVPDNASMIQATLKEVINGPGPDAVLLTGGTGIAFEDVTIEAVRPLFTKELTSFGPLFAMLSYEEIDSAALLSRATAGLIEKTIVFCMPGSQKACKLACNALIFPELGHLSKHVREG